MKGLIFFILFIPFYQGQFQDGIRTVVSSPEEAFYECKEAERFETMPNMAKFAKLYKVDLEKGTVVEVEIPKEVILKREA